MKNSVQETSIFSGQAKKEESIKVLDEDKLKKWEENYENNVWETIERSVSSGQSTIAPNTAK